MYEKNRFFIVGDRPVKYILTEDGGAGIYSFNWDTGQFNLDMSYHTLLFRGTMDDVEEVAAPEFDAYVGKLKKETGLL